MVSRPKLFVDINLVGLTSIKKKEDPKYISGVFYGVNYGVKSIC